MNDQANNCSLIPEQQVKPPVSSQPQISRYLTRQIKTQYELTLFGWSKSNIRVIIISTSAKRQNEGENSRSMKRNNKINSVDSKQYEREKEREKVNFNLCEKLLFAGVLTLCANRKRYPHPDFPLSPTSQTREEKQTE